MREKKIVLMCEKNVVHGKKKVCKQRAWKKVVCNKYL